MPLTPRELAALKTQLWPPTSLRPVTLFAVLDCARDPRIYDFLQRSYRDRACLFAGELAPEVERAAPHLVHIEPRDSLTDDLLTLGWQDAWGITIHANAPFSRLRRQLRTLLRVRDEAGRHLLFRFYDPRVLTLYLPTCTAAELESVFGSGIERLILYEQKKWATVSYAINQHGLQVESLHT